MENKIPECVGIIVDGNRRWAKARGVPTLEGHRAGYAKVKEFTEWSRDMGVKYVIAYVFSTENWNRSIEEVSYLMGLFRDVLFGGDIEWAKKEGVKVRVAGYRGRLDKRIVEGIEKMEKETAGNNRINLIFALNYGGRDEILNAVNKVKADPKFKNKEITAEDFEKFLWTAGTPDPDMIIRTSGEHRLSNFLTWQGIYSELFFPTYSFPDFTREKLIELIEEFNSRNRRFGK